MHSRYFIDKQITAENKRAHDLCKTYRIVEETLWGCIFIINKKYAINKNWIAANDHKYMNITCTRLETRIKESIAQAKDKS